MVTGNAYHEKTSCTLAVIVICRRGGRRLLEIFRQPDRTKSCLVMPARSVTASKPSACAEVKPRAGYVVFKDRVTVRCNIY